MRFIHQGPIVEIRWSDNDSIVTHIHTAKVIDVIPFEEDPLWLHIVVLRRKDNEAIKVDIGCETLQGADLLRTDLINQRNIIHKGCSWSTGIHDGPTVGRGELNGSGFWQFPCWVCARRSEFEHPERGEI